MMVTTRVIEFPPVRVALVEPRRTVGPFRRSGGTVDEKFTFPEKPFTLEIVMFSDAEECLVRNTKNPEDENTLKSSGPVVTVTGSTTVRESVPLEPVTVTK